MRESYVVDPVEERRASSRDSEYEAARKSIPEADESGLAASPHTPRQEPRGRASPDEPDVYCDHAHDHEGRQEGDDEQREGRRGELDWQGGSGDKGNGRGWW